ncbi:MAG: ATP-binding protein [Lachnospiraceae bacterium]|nr:ATP-binding protein [Lachnospiraceae bacterium]
MKEITLEADVKNIPVVTDFVNEVLEEAECPIKVQMQIDVILDEVFANIALYAYGESGGDATVCVDVSDEPKVISITFKDKGMPFDPLSREDPDVTLSVEDRKIGGLGIFMVKKMMDEVVYRYEDGMNVLTVRKKM